MSARMILMRNKMLKISATAFMMTTSAAMAGWEKLPAMPEPNGGFACGADAGGITMLGGTNWTNSEKRWLQTISHFDLATMRWEVIGRLSEPVGYGSSGIRHSDDGRHETLIMLGGSNGRTPVKATAIVDTIKTVLVPAQVLPEKIVLCAGGIVGDAFIIAGGTDDVANIAGFTNRVVSFDLTRRTIAPAA